MARRHTEPEGPPEPPRLKIASTEAQAKIDAQVKEGQELRDRPVPGTRAGDSEYSQAEDAWVEYTFDLLNTIFTSESIAEEFGSSGVLSVRIGESAHESILRTRGRIDSRIAKLLSIRRRLELMPVVETQRERPQSRAAPAGLQSSSSTAVFVVHGHDTAATSEVARCIERLGLRAIVLKDEVDRGQTLLDKFERHADVGYAVVLLTADDEGRTRGDASLTLRARQNVILEHGYFLARLGRERVTALRAPGVEVPSDLGGVLYKELDPAGAWRLALAKEIRAAGFDVDLNRL